MGITVWELYFCRRTMVSFVVSYHEYIRELYTSDGFIEYVTGQNTKMKYAISIQLCKFKAKLECEEY